MNDNKLYVAMDKSQRGKLFRAMQAPQRYEDLPRELQANTVYVVGPFRTKAAALILATGEHGPSIQTVSQFEEVARNRKARAASANLSS